MNVLHWYLGGRLAWRRGPHFLVRVWPFEVCYLRSWDHPRYPRIAAWRNSSGVTLRYCGWLLLVRL